MSQSASQETQTSNLFKRREKLLDVRQKARQITCVYTLINDNFRWTKTSIKIILIHIFSSLNSLKTRPFSNNGFKPRNKDYNL